MKHISKIALIAALSLGFVGAQESRASSPQQQNRSMQGMHKGQTHGMMQNCHKQMQTMRQSNDRTKQDIDAARQSNDPAKMRAALDEADKALSSMNEHMSACMGMMNMMQGMHGRGMMSGPQNPPQKQ
jgi:hypothetical protein